MKKLTKLFLIEAGEEKLVALTLLQSIFIGLPRLFTLTVASALFLENYSVQNLPYIYLVSSLFVPLVGFIHLFFEKKWAFFKVKIRTLLVLCLISFFFIIILWSLPNQKWTSFALFIWFDIEYVLTHMVFWSVANRLFTVRQNKRLFGLIGTGEILTAIIGGFLMPYLVQFMGISNLLFLSLGGLVLAFFNLNLIERSFEPKVQLSEPQNNIEKNQSFIYFLKNKYFMLIFSIMTYLAYCNYFFVDNIFYYEVNKYYHNSEQLAVFMGQFLAVVGITNFLFRAFLSGRWMMRFSWLGNMLTLPFILGINILLIIIISYFFKETILLFWLVILIKLFERILLGSIAYPSYYILYKPLPPTIQSRVQTFAEAIIGPIGGILVGLLLTFLNKFLELNSVGLSVVLFVFLLGYCFLVFITNQEHQKLLAT